ncbi:MAG: hypothetical protein PHN82_00915 [bacterium]|nr:hypothetical protein [bacterium]
MKMNATQRHAGAVAGLFAAALVVTLVGAAAGSNIRVARDVDASGGGRVDTPHFSEAAVIGQAFFAGPRDGGSLRDHAGFLYPRSDTPTPAPTATPTWDPSVPTPPPTATPTWDPSVPTHTPTATPTWDPAVPTHTPTPGVSSGGFRARINYQPAAVPTPDGWSRDSAAPYAERALGTWFGW